VPAGKQTQSVSHAEARPGEFLPDMDAEEQKRFTPSELLIYKHALEYRFILFFTSINSVYIWIYQFVNV
jgi:hypothetical protein